MSTHPIKLSLCQLQIGGKSGLHRCRHLQTASNYSSSDSNQLLWLYQVDMSVNYNIRISVFYHFFVLVVCFSVMVLLSLFFSINWTIDSMSDCGAPSLALYRFLYTYSPHKISNEYNTKWDVKKGQWASESSRDAVRRSLTNLQREDNTTTVSLGFLLRFLLSQVWLN